MTAMLTNRCLGSRRVSPVDTLFMTRAHYLELNKTKGTLFTSLGSQSSMQVSSGVSSIQPLDLGLLFPDSNSVSYLLNISCSL